MPDGSTAVVVMMAAVCMEGSQAESHKNAINADMRLTRDLSLRLCPQLLEGCHLPLLAELNINRILVREEPRISALQTVTSTGHCIGPIRQRVHLTLPLQCQSRYMAACPVQCVNKGKPVADWFWNCGSCCYRLKFLVACSR